MRRRIVLLAVAISSLVLIAFMVPLALVLRGFAAERAVSAATSRAQWMAPLVATFSPAGLRLAVAQANEADRAHPLTVFLPGGETLGQPAAWTSAVTLAARGRSFTAGYGGGVQVLVSVQGLDRGSAVVRAFVPRAQLRAGVRRAWLALAGVGLGLLLLSAAVADQLARTVVGAFRVLARVSDQLSDGDLTARVPVAGPPDVRQVSNALNRLAARIDELLARERETAADLSHRLRTPLTALRIDAESLRDGAERAQLVSDADDLQRTMNEIIRTARRPARAAPRPRCDASAVVSSRAAFWRPLAEDQGRPVTVDLDGWPTPVGVSGEDLTACVDVLLENVFAHTPEGVGFAVRVRPRAGGGAWLVVADAGGGFAGSAAHRGASGAGSTGLGLDIARRVAEASGGTLTVGRSPVGGAAVTVSLGPPDGQSPAARWPRRGRPATAPRAG
jgi:signal transduction histidine kinase